MPESPAAAADRARLGGAAYLAGSQQFVGNTMPLLIGAVAVSHAATPVQLGLVNSAYTAFSLLLSVSAPFWATRLPARAAAWVASVGIVLTFLLAGRAGAMEGVYLAFALAGVFSGVMGGTGHAVIGAAAVPARWYGISMAFQMAAAALFALSVPTLLVPAFGPDAMLAAMAVLYLPCIVSAALLGSRQRALPAITTRPPAPETRTQGPGLELMIAFCACLVYSMAAVAYWIFLERMGNSAGVSARFIGVSLAVSSFLAIGGAAIASRSSSRIVATFTLGIALGVASYVLALVPGNLAFLASVCAFNLSWSMSIPMLQTVIRRADRTNRLFIANQAPVFIAGTVTGPVAGYFAATSGFSGVMFFSAGATVLAFLLGITAYRMSRHSDATVAVPFTSH